MKNLYGKGSNDILRDALVKSRIFGAVFIYIGVDDGLSQDHQLAANRIKAVRFLNVLTTKELRHQSFYADPSSEKYGLPISLKFCLTKIEISSFFALASAARPSSSIAT